ncbi:MAG: ribbon-helix-helix protein, CopG family [Gammaproteobacteria bacterium]|nr:ribbon-helix-helix protein, CopG family [Gammaproteobacteria bacterium]
MHRTQIILEDWQYQALRARAEREGHSISELVREILRTALAQPPHKPGRLREIEGIAEDPAAYGRNHDRFLYGDAAKR